MHLSYSACNLVKHVFVLLIISFFNICKADDTSIDYGKGFDKFYSFGLPDVEDATYVNVTAHSYNNIPRKIAKGLYDLNLSGNGWMLNDISTNAAVSNALTMKRFAMGGIRTVEIYDKKELDAERKTQAEAEGKKPVTSSYAMMYSGAPHEDGRIGGTWKPVDLSKDIGKTLKYLKKKQKQENYDDDMSELMLFATHIYSKGYTNEANEIAEILFSLSNDRRKPLKQALNALADVQYDKTIDSFFAGGTWEEMIKDVELLTDRFGGMWNYGMAARHLVKNAKERNTEGALTNIPATLTEKEQTIVQQLANAASTTPKTRNRHYSNNNLWILSPPKITDEKDSHIIDRIKAQGMESVPLLLALLDNNYLTRIDFQSIKNSRSYYYSNSDSTSEEMVMRQYSSMRRPAALSDIASYLLKSLIINEKDEYSWNSTPMDTEDIRIAAAEWYEANKEKNTHQLARFYLSNGNSSQKRMAVQKLIKTGEEKDITAIEDHFLNTDSRSMFMDSALLTEFVSSRGAKATDFVAKYETHARKQLQKNKDSNFQNTGMKRQVDKTIVDLKEILLAKTAEEILDEVLSGSNTLTTVGTSLKRDLAKRKQTEAVSLLLNAAIKAEDSETSSRLINMTSLSNTQRYGPFDSNEDDDTDDEIKISDHAEQWRKLLSDTRSVKGRFPGDTVGSVTASKLYQLFYDNSSVSYSLYRLQSAIGARIRPLIFECAKGLLDGKTGDDLPTFPSADNVTTGQIATICNDLYETPEEELKKRISKISLSEFMALANDGTENTRTNLNNHLNGTANTITQIIGTEHLTDDETTKLTNLNGRVLNKNIIELLLKMCKDGLTDGKAITFTIWRQPSLDGMVIRVNMPNKDNQAAVNHYSYGYGYPTVSDNKSYISGEVYIHRKRETAMWPVDIPSSKDEESTDESADEDAFLLDDMLDELDDNDGLEETQATFWKQVDAVIKGDESVFSSVHVIFRGIPAKDDSDENSDSDDSVFIGEDPFD